MRFSVFGDGEGLVILTSMEREEVIRSQKVILDRDLARLYGVAAKVLNQAVKRNLDRFPEDFMFQLTLEETSAWLKRNSKHTFKVTKRDLEDSTRLQHQISTICFYRAWNYDAFESAKERSSRSGEVIALSASELDEKAEWFSNVRVRLPESMEIGDWRMIESSETDGTYDEVPIVIGVVKK